MPLPQPAVPDLGPDNAIDLDKLGNDDLLTYVDYPGIAEGDELFPNFRGCGAQGEVHDMATDPVLIGPGDLLPEGMPLYVDNSMMKALDQGWVFYSYHLYDGSAPDLRGEESLRRFFYVGKRAQQGGRALSVVQCLQSHDLYLDGKQLPPEGATLVTVPYRAMSEGDKVSLKLDLFFDVGDPYKPYVLSHEVEKDEAGQPLVWRVPKNELLVIQDGYADLSYSIEYADPTTPTESATQALQMVPPTVALLAPPQIEGFSGGDLDPNAHPDGIRVLIALYPGVAVDDEVLLYALSDVTFVQAQRLDPSNLDSGVLAFRIEHAWLAANNGKRLQLIYQYARPGVAGTSEPLAVMLRKPLNLPAPIIEKAIADGQDRGYVGAYDLTGGVNITLPKEAVIGPDDKVQMHWQGYGTIGSAVVNPSPLDPKRFQVPAEAVPANMGRRVDVFYTVTLPGEPPVPSTWYDLEVRPITDRWPTLQIEKPDIVNQQLSLAAVPATGAECLLADWPFMNPGQRLRIEVSATLANDQPVSLQLREGDQEKVTEDEWAAGLVWSVIPRSFLQTLKIDSPFNIYVTTSFDLGDSYVTFPKLDLMLIA